MWCSAAINLLKEWRTWCNHGNTCRFLPEGPRSCPTVPRSPEWLQWAFYTQATNVVGGQLDLLRNHDSSPKDCASQHGCGGSPKLQANLQSCLHAFSASNIKHAGKKGIEKLLHSWQSPCISLILATLYGNSRPPYKILPQSCHSSPLWPTGTTLMERSVQQITIQRVNDDQPEATDVPLNICSRLAGLRKHIYVLLHQSSITARAFSSPAQCLKDLAKPSDL